ncbi:oligosaccharide repeat unit polymerase [candidate division KSB1 bacterium]|nr:oligosaccharide repeat unit polymerase [candidate division KSB1 bacterium]
MGIFENITSVVLLLLFAVTVSYFSYRREGLFITPINVMVWPYVIVSIMVNVVGIHFGYFAVHLKSIFFVLSCMTFFGIGGILIQKFLNDDYEIEQQHKLQDMFTQYRSAFIIVGIIAILAGFIHFYHALNQVGGWVQIASREFEEAYGKGLLAHVMVLNRPAFLFLAAYFLYRKRVSVLALLVLMFVTVLVLQIKNNIITILLGAFYFSYLFKLVKFNLKKAFVYAIVIFVLFNVSYIIGYTRIGVSNAYSSKIQEYLVHLFFSYLFGGPIGTSEIFNYAQYPMYSMKEVFAVPINLYNVLLLGSSDIIEIIIRHWIPISTNYRFFHSTNVFGLFGMLYAFIGVYGSLIYMFFLGVFAYLLKYLSYKKNAFVGFQLVYTFFLSYLTLAFFGLFFNIIIVSEVIVVMLIVPLINNVWKMLWGSIDAYSVGT